MIHVSTPAGKKSALGGRCASFPTVDDLYGAPVAAKDAVCLRLKTCIYLSEQVLFVRV